MNSQRPQPGTGPRRSTAWEGAFSHYKAQHPLGSRVQGRSEEANGLPSPAQPHATASRFPLHSKQAFLEGALGLQLPQPTEDQLWTQRPAAQPRRPTFLSDDVDENVDHNEGTGPADAGAAERERKQRGQRVRSMEPSGRPEGPWRGKGGTRAEGPGRLPAMDHHRARVGDALLLVVNLL